MNHALRRSSLVLVLALGLAGCASPPRRIARTPPAPQTEEPSLKPGANFYWRTGHWVYEESRDDFHWEPGRWDKTRSGMVWVPGFWEREGEGWVWRADRWEEARGSGR